MTMLQATNPAPGPQLRDIHLPAPPSWWPPAPGWWILGVLMLAIGTACFVYLYRKLKLRRRRAALLAEFERIVARVAAQDDPAALAAALSSFLRRQNLRTAPRSAALSGEAWLQHLDVRIGSDEFSAGPGRALVEAPFRANASFDRPALIALVRRTVSRTFDREAAHV